MYVLLVGLFGLVFFFFFQAEDGIRDYKVTGVQTLLFRSARGGINAGPYGDGAAIDGDGIADDGAGIGPDQRDGGAAAAGVQARHAAGQAFDGDDVPLGVLALPGDGLVLLSLSDAAATHPGVRGLIDQRAVE